MFTLITPCSLEDIERESPEFSAHIHGALEKFPVEAQPITGLPSSIIRAVAGKYNLNVENVCHCTSKSSY